jgi:16S rRNA (cytosine967-C5)-methyltransferase
VGTGDLERLRSVREGRVTPQDQASQAVAIALDPQPGERVLDVASAPGGKSSAIAERMGDEGLVVAADLHASRLRLVREATGRLQLMSVQALVAAGTALPCPDDTFDRVLLDAPCSGLGVLRRRPEARWRAKPEQVAQLAALQIGLLAHAATKVRPGGRLVYSVCTLTRAETLEVDEWAARELTDFTAVHAFAAPWRPHGRGAVLLPHDAGTDGMFVLVLDRHAAVV